MIFVVKKCDDCPFMVPHDGERLCNIGVPVKRLVPSDVQRPDWCRLLKEQVIVKAPFA